MLKQDIEYEDIDSSFTSFKPPEKLPISASKELKRLLPLNISAYQAFGNSDKTRLMGTNLPSTYYFSKFLPMFSEDAVDTWIKLDSLNPNATEALASHLCKFHFYTTLTDTIRAIPDIQLNCVKHIYNSISSSIETINEYEGMLNDDGYYEYHGNYQIEKATSIPYDFLQDVIESLEDFSSRLKFIEKNLIIQKSELEPKQTFESRKKNIENAHTLYIIRMINQFFRFTFEKPLYEHQATLVNLVFQTEHDYSSISQIVRTR